MKKYKFIGYVTDEMSPRWTIDNWLNITSVIYRLKKDAIIRHGKYGKIIKVNISIEESKCA